MKSDRLKDESNKECNLDVRENIEEPKYLVESLRGKRMDLTRDRRNEWECKRRREQLEVRAVVGTDSRDCDNKCDIHQRRLDETSFRINGESHKNPAVPQQNVLDSISDIINCDNLDKLTMGESTSSKVEPLPSKSELHKMLDVSVINPDLSAILAEWEAESVSSLSPKSDTFLYKNGESKNDVIQSFLDLIPGMTISPRSSNSGSRISEHSCSEANENISPKVNEGPHSTSRLSSPSSPLASKYSPLLVVLRPRNCNQDKDPQRSKEQDDKCKISNKDETTTRDVSICGENSDPQNIGLKGEALTLSEWVGLTLVLSLTPSPPTDTTCHSSTFQSDNYFKFKISHHGVQGNVNVWYVLKHVSVADSARRCMFRTLALVSGKTGSGMGSAPPFCSLENNREAGTTLLLCFSIEGFMLQQLLHSTGKTGNFRLRIMMMILYFCLWAPGECAERAIKMVPHLNEHGPFGEGPWCSQTT
ncbi:hypothetical protein J6590_028876 [Homalodisca vitripennis]|nr:hypothetical protein J6590_028876 [Homalodisca vitripennis]